MYVPDNVFVKVFVIHGLSDWGSSIILTENLTIIALELESRFTIALL